MTASAADGTGPVVVSVCVSGGHTFSKPPAERITLIEGLGIEGDAHAGKLVQHLYDIERGRGDTPNLRQVHFQAQEVLDEANAAGFTVAAGQMGDNVTTRGIELLTLPRGTRFVLGSGGAVVQITGLRQPCRQIDDFQKGLLRQLITKDANGKRMTKSGIMGIVLSSGPVAPGDAITVELPAGPHEKLDYV